MSSYFLISFADLWILSIWEANHGGPLYGLTASQRDLDEEEKPIIKWLFGTLFSFPQRDLLPKEKNLETVLTLAFLEIDKAFAKHAHLSADGK